MDLVYVAAVLEKQHDVCIIDAPTEGWKKLQEIGGTRIRQGLTNEEIAARIRKWSPDLAVITIPFSGWSRAAFETASIVKDVNKDIVTVLIGLHPSARPLECLAQPNIDFVVFGEPEMTVLELADTFEKDKGRLGETEGSKGNRLQQGRQNNQDPSKTLNRRLGFSAYPSKTPAPDERVFRSCEEETDQR